MFIDDLSKRNIKSNISIVLNRFPVCLSDQAVDDSVYDEVIKQVNYIRDRLQGFIFCFPSDLLSTNDLSFFGAFDRNLDDFYAYKNNVKRSYSELKQTYLTLSSLVEAW